MDLYGLIWFIDETVLPDEREFLARYLRRPEHYPELSERVRPYCFRTLRAQAQSYALALRLLGLQGSSTTAILQTIRGVIKRLEQMPNTQGELIQWRQMEDAAKAVGQDAKAAELLDALHLGFTAIEKRGAAKKAIIFTESVETQKMLFRLLRDRYKTLLSHGGADHTAI